MTLPSLAFHWLITSAAFAGIDTKRVPIEIDIPPARWAEMSPEARAAIETLRRELIDSTWLFEKADVELPETVFADDAVVLNETDLFPRPYDGAEDLEGLAHDESGTRLKLDQKQYDDLRQKGQFIVPSRRFPGRNHVWKMTWRAQVGRENIRASFKAGANRALDELVVDLPARWSPNRPASVFEGGRTWLRAARGVLAQAVGLIERVPKFTDAEVEAMITRHADERLRLDHPDLDFRLYDAELMARVAAIVDRISIEADRAWPAREEAWLKAELPALRARGLEAEALAETAHRRLAAHRYEDFLERVGQSPALEALSPGLGALVVNRERALKMTERAEAQVNESVGAFADAWRTRYVRRHPLLARTRDRVERKLVKPLAAWRVQARRERAERLVTELDEAGLRQEALVLRANVAYFFADAERLRREYGAVEIAAREYQFRTPLWRARNWTPVPQTDERGETRFTAEKFRTRRLATNYPGWRNALFALRTNEAFWTWNHALVVENLVNGPVGLRALFNLEPFFPDHAMDPTTGRIDRDLTRPRATLASRQRDIWARVGQSKARFEASEDRGIIPKDRKRPAYYAYYALRAVAQSGFYGVGQLGSTVLNVPLTLGCVAASPGVALAYGAACDLFDWTFDVEQRHLFKAFKSPLLLNVVERPVLGTAEIIAGLAGSAGHLILAPSILTGSAAAAGFKFAKDEAANAWFKFRDAKVPVADERGLLKHVSGPGVRASYAYQVSPRVALVVLTAALENVELGLFERRVEKTLREPVVNAQAQVERTFGALVSAQPGAWMSDVHKSSNEALAEAKAKFGARRRRLPLVTAERRDVHLAEEDLGRTLDAAAELSRNFWERSDERLNWSNYGLAEGDHRGLGKLLLERVFGTQVTKPMVAEDDTFVIGVTTPKLGHVLEDVLRGSNVDFATIEGDRVVTPPAPKAIGNVDPRLPRLAPLGEGLSRVPCEVILKR